jgi:hypothetical protein
VQHLGALLTVLGNTPPAKIVINELTTVASTFTSARFIQGEAISGNALGLRIAAGNARNLVDPATGGWGKVLLDPLNSSMTTTLAKLDTLGSLITYATVADDDWRARYGRIVAAARFDRGYATFGNHIEGNVLVGCLCGAKIKSAIVAGFRLSQLFGFGRACGPKSTVEFASGPPLTWTWPSTRTPDCCCADASVPAAVMAANSDSTASPIVLIMLMLLSPLV